MGTHNNNHAGMLHALTFRTSLLSQCDSSWHRTYLPFQAPWFKFYVKHIIPPQPNIGTFGLYKVMLQIQNECTPLPVTPLETEQVLCMIQSAAVALWHADWPARQVNLVETVLAWEAPESSRDCSLVWLSWHVCQSRTQGSQRKPNLSLHPQIQSPSLGP